MESQKSITYKMIYSEIQLKETDDLLEIWYEHNPLEWTDEAFLVVHDILLERLGEIPEENPLVNQSKPQENGKIHYWNKDRIICILIVLVPSILLFIYAVLDLPNASESNNQLYSIIIFGLLSITLLLSGIYLIWNVLFNRDQFKQEIGDNLPSMKKRMGIIFRFYTFFLPDRLIPNYFIFQRVLLSVCLIGGGLLESIALITNIFY